MNPGDPGATPLAVDYFDGRSARAQPVHIHIEGSELRIEGAAIDLRLPLRDVRWPERTRHGARIAQLRAGGALQARDPALWDDWLLACGVREPAIVSLQQSWRWVLASVAALVLAIGVFFVWGVPWLARGVVALIPPTIDARIGESALASIDGQLLEPSKLSPQRQARVRAAFESALAAAPPQSVPAHQVLFRRSRIGPNAFALPGGSIVLTDELVDLMQDDSAALTGVLAHELGHVRQRHGMRLVVQVGAVGALASLVLGDFSSLLTAAPVLLGQAAYSRDAEREADAQAVQVLHAAGISPEVMVTLFERLAEKRGDGAGAANWLGVAIASHPADAARIAYFRAAARAR